MRKFNTTGPCFPDEHYMLPALDRLPGIRELVASGNYFVVHAPRQTGKTTALQALAHEINEKGDMFAIYCTLETLQNASDLLLANKVMREIIVGNAKRMPSFPRGAELPSAATDDGQVLRAVRSVLTDICDIVRKPVVVFFDEADCLVGDVLISFLRQLRDGYVNRKMIPFPKSVALVGMLDVRDYKAQIRPDGESLGQISPFNITAEDMLIPNFTEADILALYAQHTADTGQVFADGVVEYVWRLTRGQPWLVNAIAHECVTKIHGCRYGEAITVEDVEAAKETIIRRRDTHVDSLMERMREPRVRRLVEPLILGNDTELTANDDDYGGGHINREMALGQGRLDLCVEFRGARYAIEVKTSANFKDKTSYEQCAKYLDDLGLSEGWMPIFDKSKTKTWDEKIYTRDEVFNGKTIHVIGL